MHSKINRSTVKSLNNSTPSTLILLTGEQKVANKKNVILLEKKNKSKIDKGPLAFLEKFSMTMHDLCKHS